MAEVLCGFTDTVSGTPCQNQVSTMRSKCAAGHQVPNWGARMSPDAKPPMLYPMLQESLDVADLGLVPADDLQYHGGSIVGMQDGANPDGPLYGLVSFDDDGLVLSDEAAAKVRRERLSPSTANSMYDCGARWSLERLLPRQEDPFGPAELGTSAHRVFEKLYELPPEQRTPTMAKDLVRSLDQDAEADKLAIPGDEEINKWRWGVYGLVQHVFEVEDPTTVDVVGNEIAVNTTLGGVPFGGFVDRLARRDGVLTVSDWKTGKLPNPRFPNVGYDEQLRLYTLALREIGHQPEAAELIYTKFGKRHKVDIDESLLKGSLARFQNAWDRLERQTDAQKFDYKPGTLCSWCPAFDSCPGAAGKSRHKNSTQPDLSPEDLGIGRVTHA